MQLYKWQQACLERWLAAGGRGIVRAATGTGKTVMALAAVQALESLCRADLRVKIIVPRVFLARQWAETIRKIYGATRADIGICSGELRESSRKFTVYVINTARYSAARHIVRDFAAGRAVFLICDECHHLGSEENSRVFEFLPHAGPDNYYALGLSATPDCRRYESTVIPALGPEIYSYDLNAARQSDVVAEYAVHSVGVHFRRKEQAAYADLSEKLTAVLQKLGRKFPALSNVTGEAFFLELAQLSKNDREWGSLAAAALHMLYKRKEIVHSAGERQDCATALARLLPLGSRTIFFLERIEAADALYERLSEFLGGRVRRYHSALSREVKRRSLAAYREGEACALVCCHALDEGLDIPDTDTGVIVSATGAARQRIQRLGRLLRRGERKNVYYIYVVDSAEDAVLLPELPAGEELFFFERTGRFTNRPYDALVARWRQRLPRRGLTPEQTAEVERHLRRGAIRDDYRLGGALCLERALAAEGSERNYWITMKMLADEGDIPEVVW